MDTDLESDLTEAVIGAAFEVANVLGTGFLEKVYERALVRKLASRDGNAKPQVSFRVCYKGHYVGEYVADLAQCINYLKAARLPVALLISFQKPRVEWKRVLLDQ